MSKSLYTTREIKEERDRLIDFQKGIDPILQEKFKEVVVLDHDHTTQYCRAALNRNVNAFEGLVFNAYKRCLGWLTDKPLPDILRNLATYLEQDYSENPFHTGWMKRVKIDFNRLTASQMDFVLQEFGERKGRNLADRKKLFAGIVMRRNLGYNKISEVLSKARDS